MSHTIIIKANSTQIVDSTHILGAGAVKDTYTLIKTAIQKLFAVSRKKNRFANRKLKDLKLILDYSQKSKEDIDWDNSVCRQELLNWSRI